MTFQRWSSQVGVKNDPNPEISLAVSVPAQEMSRILWWFNIHEAKEGTFGVPSHLSLLHFPRSSLLPSDREMCSSISSTEAAKMRRLSKQDWIIPSSRGIPSIQSDLRIAGWKSKDPFRRKSPDKRNVLLYDFYILICLLIPFFLVPLVLNLLLHH